MTLEFVQFMPIAFYSLKTQPNSDKRMSSPWERQSTSETPTFFNVKAYLGNSFLIHSC